MIKRFVFTLCLIASLAVFAYAGRTVPSNYICACNPGPNNEPCVDDGGQMLPECDFATRLIIAGSASLANTPDVGAGSMLLFGIGSLIVLKKRLNN